MRCLKCGNKVGDSDEKCNICGALIGKKASKNDNNTDKHIDSVIASDFPDWDLTPPDSMVFRKKKK